MAFVLYDESWTLLGAYSARASSGAWAGLGSPIIPLRADVPFTQSPDGGIEIEDPVPRRYRSLLVAAGDIDGVAFRFHGAETTLLAQGDRTFYLEGHESTQTVATVQANAALYRVAVARDARIHFDVRGTFVGSIGPLGSAIHGTERVEWISPAGAATCSCWSGALNGTGMGVAGEHTILWNATSVRYFGRPILLGAMWNSPARRLRTDPPQGPGASDRYRGAISTSSCAPAGPSAPRSPTAQSQAPAAPARFPSTSGVAPSVKYHTTNQVRASAIAAGPCQPAPRHARRPKPRGTR